MKLTINKQTMLLLVLITVSILVIPSFLPKSDYGTETTSAKPETTSPKIEIILFHATIRCESCTNVEKWTLEVLQDYHKEEFDQGSITFQAVNAPKNPDLVIKYNVQSMSLYINGEIFPEAFQYSDSDDHETFVRLLNQKLESIK